MGDMAINCHCCTLDESSKYAAESITADRLSPSLPLDGWQCSHDKPEQLRNADSAAERQPQTSVNEPSVPIHQRLQVSESTEDRLQPSMKGVTLTFSRPNGLHEDAYFESRPLGLRFSDTTPLTVTHVSSDYANSARVNPRVNLGWVVTHVNKVPVPRFILDANAMVRDAVSQLPCDARGTPKKVARSSSNVAPGAQQRARSHPPWSSREDQDWLNSLPRSMSLEARLMAFSTQNPSS
ncbi:unnamed protein product [Symbiodinium sp. CCMP2456]|nr:unnamed protein product [Symbiodinium sp. CCMP2456]